MRTRPKISIVTPSFNQGDYIGRTIQSVLDQNYPNLEYIIIDGGSTDNSVEIIKQYSDRLTYWISEKDNGQSHALNKGLRMVTGDIVAWINSDDWYDEGVFELVADLHQRNPDAIILGNCTRHYIGSGRRKFLRPQTPTTLSLLRYWRSNFCPPQPSIFFPASVLRKVGVLDEQLNFAMDLDLWIRMSKTSNFCYVDKNLSHYLIHDFSKSGSGNGFIKFRKEWRKVCFKHVRDVSWKDKVLFYFDFVYHRIFRPDRLAEA